MARGRKRGRGRVTPRSRASPVEEDLDTSDEVPPEILNDVDDEDDDDEVAFREAIRLSQIDQMSDLRKREEEEFQKALQLSLVESSSTSSAPEDVFVTPSTSFSNKTTNSTTAAEADGSVSEVFLAPSSVSALNDSVVEVVVDSGRNGGNKRSRNKPTIDIDSCDDEEGCDSTVLKGRRGRGRGGRGGRGDARAARNGSAHSTSRSNVTSTRGRRGRKSAAAAVLPKVEIVANGDDSDEDSDLNESVSVVFAESDDTSQSSGDEYNPPDGDVCSSTTLEGGARGMGNQNGASGSILNNAQIASKMKSIFETSLKLHMTGQFMQPCEAIATQLYPHQMYALAWMTNRENHKNLGMKGGILADDMGLGKTLTIISLVLTNFHDEKPLAKPQFGFRRRLSRAALRYLPSAGDSSKFSGSGIETEAGAKLKRGAKSKTGLTRRKKDTKQKVKSSRTRGLIDSSDDDDDDDNFRSSHEAALKSMADSSLKLEFDDGDEFDALCGDQKSLGERLGVTPESAIFSKPKTKFFDDLSDDEEYQNMTEEERNEKMKPKFDLDLNVDSQDDNDDQPTTSKNSSDRCKAKLNSNLNLDGATAWDNSDSDFEEPCSSSSNNLNTRGRKRPSTDVCPEPSKKRERDVSPSILDDDYELPSPTGSISLLADQNGGDSYDLPDLDNGSDLQTPVREKSKNVVLKQMMELTPTQKKNLKIPPKEIASLNGRRRATLIITPASLIGQWLAQIEMHVHNNVNLDIFVHHGQSKALIALELQDKDIVLTTYGTLMAEFKEENHGPLLRAKWLRVVLDEGHQIKNSRAKTFKAAANLDTIRKWIVSGTPIQNNLAELWTLLCWLGEPNYGENRPMFKNHIEMPIKRGHPRGVERLQVLMQTICLRRTKSDEVNGRPLISLPTKTITLKELEFNPEEKTIYEAYFKQGRDLIQKYMRRGNLLRNYGHIFAVMMRLRQLCCHRELLPVKWQEVDMKELASFAAADIGPDASDANGGLDQDVVKRLAEQLRQMIKEGMSDECAICLSEFDHPVITPCAHIYCRPCITQHIDTATPPATCPLCRGPIKVNLLLEAARDEETDDGAKTDSFDDIVAELSSTKVNAVLKELEISRRKDPTDKVIIVSQFTSLLSIMQPLLTDAGYNWSRLDGSMSIRDRLSVIDEFQNTGKDTPTVLLLSLRAGGVGLNLTAASRLFLLDPAWNPSTEEQCFDRIHRLGQTKDVEVVKFVMKDSIEQRMLRIQDKKRDLISGAFRQTENERREQRIQDIRDIFDL